MRTYLLAALWIPLIIAPAQAQAPSDVADLVGARGAGGESELQRRGYIFVRTTSGDDRKWSIWWNAARRQCVSVVTMDGRYAAITATPAPDCERQGGTRNRDRQREAYPPMIEDRRAAIQVGRPSYADRDGGSQDDGSADIALVCFGDGQRPTMANSSEWTWNRDKRRYDHGTRTELTQEHFDASLMLQFRGDTGRIRLPKKLIPPIHSRGQEDWWELDKVAVDRDMITGSYRLNGLNKPRLVVDRRSGRITVTGTGDYAFRGTCDLVGDGRARRF